MLSAFAYVGVAIVARGRCCGAACLFLGLEGLGGLVGWLRLRRGWRGLGVRRLGRVVGEAFGGAGVVVVGCIGAAIGFVGWDMVVVVAVACMRVASGVGLEVGRVVGWAVMCIEIVGEVADMFEYVKAAYMGLLVG